MKNFYLTLSLLAIITMSSCKPALYLGSYNQVNQTQVVLSNSNFKVLGSFTGSAITKISSMSIKDKNGMVALAKANLLENARSQGVELTGSRTLINVTTDVIQNIKHVKVVVSAEIIEFTN